MKFITLVLAKQDDSPEKLFVEIENPERMSISIEKFGGTEYLRDDGYYCIDIPLSD